MRSATETNRSASGKFQQVLAPFLAQPGLPFAVRRGGSAERVQRIFAKHENLLAMCGLFSTVNVLWAFLGQILRDGKEAACQAAVAAITAQRRAAGLATPTSDTGDDCKARAKLSEVALCERTVEIADELEERAEAPWLWKGLHANCGPRCWPTIAQLRPIMHQHHDASVRREQLPPSVFSQRFTNR